MVVVVCKANLHGTDGNKTSFRRMSPCRALPEQMCECVTALFAKGIVVWASHKEGQPYYHPKHNV